MEEIELTRCGEKIRLDKFISDECRNLSRSYVQKLIDEGNIICLSNPAKKLKAGDRIGDGEAILLQIPDPQTPDICPENIPLDILYEDADILVINKPKGMVVHPANGHSTGTVVNAVLYHCHGELSGINGVQRPGIVHRIDQDTTGSLIICKNDFAHTFIADQLKVHSITRKYVAIVHGNMKEETMTIHKKIGRSLTDRKKMSVNCKNGKDATTHCRVLEQLKGYTYVECTLETGRTHQIRVHMASAGHPVLGDTVYGPSRCPIPNLQGQTLHAKTIGFIHPSSREYVEFDAPLPDYFTELLSKLR
ncbi:MAG: RluA family pseudouridine synthase [Lachnospiraceae bacterium]|nr:RluA family pseudouridine synthase [Lachnospiraceae bacterium]